MRSDDLPVAVIGAGPVGLAAAAHLIDRKLRPLVLEAGPGVGHHVRDWGHVRMFSPWRSLIDPVARRLLDRAGWRAPDPEDLPTGRELVDRYLEPLSNIPALRDALRLGSRALGVTRRGLDKATTADRVPGPFTVMFRDAHGEVRRVDTGAVIDASGTWATQSPLAADGLSAAGEDLFRARIRYGVPDVLGQERTRYAGKVTAVVGSGYSAANTMLDLLRLRVQATGTRPVWVIRRPNLSRLLADESDGLPARLAIGRSLVERWRAGDFDLVTGFHVRGVAADGGSLRLLGAAPAGEKTVAGLDEIVCNTGQRPDLALTRELRLSFDPALDCVAALAPLIDPNIHSCYSVPPHGWAELRHPLEPNAFIIGSKSYGRAPTFLAVTGYEQARSVAAALAGDRAAADRTALAQPDTAS